MRSLKAVIAMEGIETVSPLLKEMLMYGMGLLVLICTFVLVGMLFFRTIDPGNKDLVNIALGALLGMAVNVVGYFYGSSKGSADKTAVLLRNGADTKT